MLRSHVSFIFKQGYKNLSTTRITMFSPRIKIAQGELEGQVAISPGGIEYCCFQGIPYAKPPIGDLRFKDPVPANNWDGVLKATKNAEICPQISRDGTRSIAGDEDCLYLNIYTPRNISSESLLPVMVWIHGGAYIHGSGNQASFGPEFLIAKNVIMVSMNYRLSVFGFLSLDTPDAPGNAGLKDQALSLKWVHDNIKQFGGDSNNVTLFGESAGASSVMYLVLSPITRGLIHKAIIQSGSALCHWARQTNPVESALKLANLLGCKTSDKNEVLKFLQKVPMIDLLKASYACLSKREMKRCYTSAFLPVIEKEFDGVVSLINENPENIIATKKYESISIIIGFTAKESIILFDPIKHNINRVNEIVDNFQYFIPPEMELSWNSEKSLDVASKIKKFYFKDEPVYHKTAENAVDLLSDYTFIRGVEMTVDLFVQNSESPIYYFKFSYLGNLNNWKESLEKMNLKEAGHSDENNYIFRKDRHENINVTTSDELTRNRLIQLWTDFAKHGNPTPSVSANIETIWKPVTADEKNCIEITEELKIIVDPNANSMNFWKTLHNDLNAV